MRRSRRHFLHVVATSVAALVTPAQAQWWEPVSKALGVISTALNIAALLAPWLHFLTADKRCKVPIDDLENIKIDCQVLSQTLEDETIPLLEKFVTSKDSQIWKWVRVSIAQLLADGIVLTDNINRVVAKLDADTYAGPKEHIEKLYHGVDSIRATMVILGRLPDSPEPEDFKLAGVVLSAITSFPEMAKAAVAKLQLAIDDRRMLNCQQ
jgi:hypothetical protein